MNVDDREGYLIVPNLLETDQIAQLQTQAAT